MFSDALFLQVMTNLKVLDLTNCKNLTATPDLSSNTKLERLILEGCNRLATIHKSIGALECLTHLNAKGCNLSEIPVELCSLTALTEIRITREDKGSLELPESFGNLKSLLILEISGVTMTRLPCSIEKLTNLERLYLCDSHVKKRLPNPIGKLISLTELDISKAVVELPDNIGNLKRLKALKMNDCTIRGLPTSIVEAEQLEVLLAEGCTNLKGLAENIHKLSRLKLLDVSGSKICRLPKRISALSHLQTLLLASTEKIRRLPKLPTSLTSLRIKPLEEVPDLSELKNLTDLVIGGVADGESTPIRQTHDLLWMGKLSKLRCLELYFPNATTKLPNFGGLTRLVSLNLTCLNIEGSWQLPSGLSMLILNLKMTLPNLSTSKNLSILRCYNCSINDDSFSSLPGSELRLLKHFLAEKCNISTERGLCLPKDLAILSIAECQFQKRKSINLSGLSSLKRLKLSHCKALSVVRGLRDLKSLQELIVEDCKSLKKLENSSDWTDLKSLEVLHALRCKNLVTRELDRLDFPKHKVISGCKSD